MKLFVINLWAWHNNCDVAQEPFTYVVAADDIDEAIAVAIQQSDKSAGDIHIDMENSYEITEAYSKVGIVGVSYTPICNRMDKVECCVERGTPSSQPEVDRVLAKERNTMTVRSDKIREIVGEEAIQTLEDAGFQIVEKAHFEALHRLYRAMYSLHESEKRFDEAGEEEDAEGQCIALGVAMYCEESVDRALNELSKWETKNE